MHWFKHLHHRQYYQTCVGLGTIRSPAVTYNCHRGCTVGIPRLYSFSISERLLEAFQFLLSFAIRFLLCLFCWCFGRRLCWWCVGVSWVWVTRPMCIRYHKKWMSVGVIFDTTCANTTAVSKITNGGFLNTPICKHVYDGFYLVLVPDPALWHKVADCCLQG